MLSLFLSADFGNDCLSPKETICMECQSLFSGKIREISLRAAVTNTVFPLSIRTSLIITMPASVAQLDAPSDWRPGGRGFNPRRGWQHSFVEIDHEILSTVILSLPLIQEGQLSVSGERMCTILVNRLED